MMDEWYTSTAVFATANRARDGHWLRFIEVSVCMGGQCIVDYSIWEGDSCDRERALVVHYILVYGSTVLLILT